MDDIDEESESQRVEFVYFIEAKGTDLIKIGKAFEPYKRLAELQTSCPFDLELIVALDAFTGMEKLLHRKFVSSRKRGEWFWATPRIRRFIATSIESIHDPIFRQFGPPLAIIGKGASR